MVKSEYIIVIVAIALIIIMSTKKDKYCSGCGA
jgi:hypothetical protein